MAKLPVGTYDWMMDRRKRRYEASSSSNRSSNRSSSIHSSNGVELETSISINSTQLENVRRQLQREAYEQQLRQNQRSRNITQQPHSILSPRDEVEYGRKQEEQIQAPERSFRRYQACENSHHSTSTDQNNSIRSYAGAANGNVNNGSTSPTDLRLVPPKLKLSGTDLLRGMLGKASPRVAIYPSTQKEFCDLEKAKTDPEEDIESVKDENIYPTIEDACNSERSVATIKYA